MELHCNLKNLKSGFSQEYIAKINFSLKTYHPNVAIPHLFVYFKTILVDFSAQKVKFNFVIFCLIVKSMISLYNLNTRADLPIYFHKL